MADKRQFVESTSSGIFGHPRQPSIFFPNMVVALLALAIAAASAVPMNMNGEYLIGNPNTRVKAQYSTDYGTKNAEYFDVYTPPIRTVYGEVFWSVSLV
jgi:hypothetical protein